MTAIRNLMLTFIVGAAIGAIAATQIRAQTQGPPAFFVSEATIHDPQLYEKFLAAEQPVPRWAAACWCAAAAW